MVTLKDLQLTAQCLSGDQWHSSGLGFGTSAVFVVDMDSGIECAPSASLPMVPSCVVKSACWREGTPSKGALTGLRGRPM